MDIELSTIIQALIIGLTGSGGLVGLYTIWVSRQNKKDEYELEKQRLLAEQSRLEAKPESQSVATRMSLEYHPLFTMIDEIEYFFTRNFKLSDEGRTKIVRELCVNKLRLWRNIIKKYAEKSQICYDECKSCRYSECNKSENELSKMMIEGMEAYVTMWDDDNIYDVFGKVKYDKESIETMKIFLPIFTNWHQSREEIVRMATHEIPNSGVNIDCYGDWWDILSVYSYAFVQMKYDALGAMKQLNGELTGKQFLGITIGSDH